jgi:hypothetical protein
MQKQSRQSLKFQVLLAERAHFMRRNLTETEEILWRRISGKQLLLRGFWAVHFCVTFIVDIGSRRVRYRDAA